MVSRTDLPTGTVTFLFTDIEGSTRLLHELGPDRYADALAEHRRIVRVACLAHGGVEIDTQGDAFFFAFPTAPGALKAAADALEGLAHGPVRARMGVHTGTPHVGEEGYVGVDVHRAARIAASGHGGQVLVSAATAALVGTQGLRDLGEHRLKDLTAAERIHQLGEADFPPLKSLHQTNLPVPATPFLGRRTELAEIGALLNRDDVRLVTLTGPGGMGKTRLALQSAGAMADRFEDGIWWVPLAPLRDPRLVLATAAQAVGAREGLAEHIGARSMLVLFDNFEQLVEAAPEVGGLLATCPRLTVMVTSREALRLEGEWEYAVDPLQEVEAIELFEARARSARRDFVSSGDVGKICARLDNLPLAIELAAARVKLLSPRVLLERLDSRLPVLAGGARDAPERQRTLRATIEWSHELLSAEEQRLFARLAVFRGGCSLEAAEAVCQADLETLGSLVDKSLVRQRDDRFSMLETIREFGVERLEASSEASDVRRDHAQYFVAMAEEAELGLRSDLRVSVDRLELEHDNIRAALDRLEASGESELALRLAGAVWRFWYLKSHLSEGRRRLERALAVGEAAQPAARAKAFSGLAVMFLNLGDAATALARAEEALTLHRALGDRWGAAYAAFMVGNAVSDAGDAARALPLMAQSVEDFQTLGDEHYALIASNNLAWLTGDAGDPEGERALHEDNLRRARRLGEERIEAQSLAQLALFLRDDGRIEEASSMLRAALRIEHDVGDVLQFAVNLGRLASVLAVGGRAETAARLLASSETLTAGLGASVPFWAGARNEKTLAKIRAQLDERTIEEALDQGRLLSADDALGLALGPAERSGDGIQPG